MKVLEERKIYGGFPLEMTCQQIVDENGYSYGKKADYCGSKLLVETGDIKKRTWSKYPDIRGIDYGVVCPICGSFTPIKEELIPTRVMDKAPLYTRDKD